MFWTCIAVDTKVLSSWSTWSETMRRIPSLSMSWTTCRKHWEVLLLVMMMMGSNNWMEKALLYLLLICRKYEPEPIWIIWAKESRKKEEAVWAVESGNTEAHPDLEPESAGGTVQRVWSVSVPLRSLAKYLCCYIILPIDHHCYILWLKKKKFPAQHSFWELFKQNSDLVCHTMWHYLPEKSNITCKHSSEYYFTVSRCINFGCKRTSVDKETSPKYAA